MQDNKIVILGSQGVGKTSLVKRYVKDVFDGVRKSTIAAEHSVKKVYEDEFELAFWDTSGERQFRNLLPIYYRGANVVIVVYDITKKQTFVEAEGLLSELTYHGSDFEQKQILLVGTKNDLTEQREVGLEQLIALAQRFGVQYFECSAKENLNVNTVFDHVKNLVFTEIANKAQEKVKIIDRPKETVNAIFMHIENAIKLDTDSANPWWVGFWGSRYLNLETANKRARVPTSIKRIHDLCKRAREINTHTAHLRAISKIATIVCDKELRVKNSFWNRIVLTIRAFLARHGWVLSQSVRKEVYQPFYTLLAENGFLKPQQKYPVNKKSNTKKNVAYENDEYVGGDAYDRVVIR